jgi:NAD(P)-dependent dehydrogenase (short-subunit alcohol dehydrogenase family)
MTIQEKFDLTGRVAVVTGGVGLLGAEFCRTLAEAGAAVVVVDLNASASQAVADSLAKGGFKSLSPPTSPSRRQLTPSLHKRCQPLGGWISLSTAPRSIRNSIRTQSARASLPALSRIIRLICGTPL